MLITTTKEQDMQEKVLAEAKLVGLAAYRLVRTEDGEYSTEYEEGPIYERHSPQSLLKAIADFTDAVVQDAIDGAEQETQEKVLAEAELAGVADYRVIREEVGDYSIEYAEGERSSRHSYSSLLKAMEVFNDAVVQEELTALAHDHGVRVS